MPKSKKKRARDGRNDKADLSSDDEMPKKQKVCFSTVKQNGI